MTSHHRVTGVLTYDYEGWNVDQAYQILSEVFRELGYLTYETQYIKADPRDPETGSMVHIIDFSTSKEVDYKYASQYIWVRLMMNFKNHPKPGSDPKNPVMAPYGSMNIKTYGGLCIDYVGLWSGGSGPITEFLRHVRERYFYRRKAETFKVGVRQDIDKLMKRMEERITLTNQF